MAAAVADFRPAGPADDKIKKTGRDGLALELEPTADVLAGVSARRAGRPDAGRASPPSTAQGGLERARDKLERKGLDAVVLNDISRPDIGFDTEDNEVTMITAAGERPCRSAPSAPWRLPSSIGWKGSGPHKELARERPEREARSAASWSTTCSGAAARCSRRATSPPPPCRSSGRASSSPTRPRSARRWAGPTSARAASRRRARSSPRWSSGPRSTTTPTSAWARRWQDRPPRRGAPPRHPRRLHAPGPRGLPGAPGPAARRLTLDVRRPASRAGRLGRRLQPRRWYSRTATAPSTTRPSRRSSSRSSTARHRQVGVHPHLLRRGAGEARHAGLAVPPQQHPWVDAVRAIERVGLRADSRPSASRRPTSSGQPPAWSAATVTPHSPWASRRVAPGRASRYASITSTAAMP